MTRRALHPSGLLMVLASAAAGAAGSAADPDYWALCEPDELSYLITDDTGAGEDVPIHFSGDALESTESDVMLEGSVEIEQGDRRLYAPSVMLDRSENLVVADEGATYGDPRLAVRARSARIDLDESVGRFDEADYYFPERNARGSADAVIADRRSRVTRFTRPTFTTCRRGAEFWELRADRLRTDENKDRAYAHDVSLALGDVPVFWMPYLSFPISDERQSGFLVPEPSLDDERGADLRLPYYWNIAPNQDMTLSPRVMTRRGFMFGVEYRFLQPAHRGEIDVEYIPRDIEDDKGRGSGFLLHQWELSDELRSELLVQRVSDGDYVEDFSNNLGLLSDTHLESRLDLGYEAHRWRGRLRVQDFQVLDDEVFGDREPYSRLPQLLASGHWPSEPFDLNYGVDAELVYFDRDAQSPLNDIDGLRFDLMPAVSYPMDWTAGYLRPRLGYRYTAYMLSSAVDAGANEDPSRALPFASLDAGLFLERRLDWGDWHGLQTLEPRLFYLYVPFEDQSDIPLFDTTDVDTSFAALFLENRFTGADRFGDANQITAALSSRFLNAGDGRERVRLSAGQTYFFRDREVQLRVADEPSEDNSSEVFAEAVARLNPRFSIRGTATWEPDDSDTKRSALDLRYRASNSKIANFSYRFAEDGLEQLDLSAVWRVRPEWRLMGRFNYSLDTERTLDAFAGLEYSDCCWAVRLLARQRREKPQDEDTRDSILLELELKGLSSLGNRIDRLLERNIVGFEAPED